MTTGTAVDDIDIAQHSHDSTGGADQRVSTRDGSRANTDIVMRSSETHGAMDVWHRTGTNGTSSSRMIVLDYAFNSVALIMIRKDGKAWAEHYTGVEIEMCKRRDGNGRGKDQAKFGPAKTEVN
eukprot:scaffold2520_cov134-Skeletonema_dohrnii-CCMP3373.AAC.2